MQIAPNDLTLSDKVQPRAQMNMITIQEYAQDMQAGAKFPPIEVVSDGDHYWVWDGFHRTLAAISIDLSELEANIILGTIEDARWLSLTANKGHGLRRTNEDKRRVVENALAHPKSKELSDREIARHCGVGNKMVSRYRESICVNNTDNRTVTRQGKTYIMDTSNIGRLSQRKESQPAESIFNVQDDPGFGPLIRGPIGNYRECNGIKRCGKCGELWGADLDYCPYCNISREARILYIQKERQNRSQVASQQVQVTVFSHETVEYYTPLKYIEAACEVLGIIDLDPASCEAAQMTVKAEQFYTKDDDGLQCKWFGHVWLNPPYSKTAGKSNQGTWSHHLANEYRQGNVQEAILLVKAALGYKWFEELWCDWPVCFARERLSFIKADGTSNGQSKQGTAFVYFGPNPQTFKDVFCEFGRVIMPEEK